MAEVSTLENETIEFNCPACGESHTVSLKQVLDRETIVCKCGRNIRLYDKDGSIRKALDQMKEVLSKMKDTAEKAEEVTQKLRKLLVEQWVPST